MQCITVFCAAAGVTCPACLHGHVSSLCHVSRCGRAESRTATACYWPRLPAPAAPPRPRDTAAAAPGKLQTSGMAQSAVCLHYLSDFVILTNWHWLQQRFHTPHFLKPTVNNPQDKPKSLRMCRVFSWIGWLPSFNLSLQGKWICCKPFLFTLLCWLVPGFVFLFFVGRKIFGCSISCSSSDGAEMKTAASARHGTKLGDLMDLQLKMSFAIFFGLRSEKSGRWLCF